MHKSKTLTIATSVAGVVAAAVLWQKLLEERQATVQLNQRIAGMERALAQYASVPAGKAEMTLPPDTLDDRAGGSAGTQASTEGAISTSGAQHRANRPSVPDLLRDPEFRKARSAQLLAELSQVNGDLARDLGLTPEQAKTLFELLAQQQLDAGSVALAAGNHEVGDQAVQQAMGELARQQRATLKGMLGEAGYVQYREYQQTLPTRKQVEQWRATLTAANAPLSEDQRRPLIARLVAEQQDWRKTYVEGADLNSGVLRTEQQLAERRLDSVAERNRRMLEVAESYLDPQQVAVLRGELERQLNLARASLRVQNSQQKDRAP